MARKVTKYRRSLRACLDGFRYYRGNTLTHASPKFSTKSEAKKWLKSRQKQEKK